MCLWISPSSSCTDPLWYSQALPVLCKLLQALYATVTAVSVSVDAPIIPVLPYGLDQKGECCCYLVTSVISSSVTPWTVAHQASLSMGFSRQEYWSGLPFPSPGDLRNPGIELASPCIGRQILNHWATWEAYREWIEVPYYLQGGGRKLAIFFVHAISFTTSLPKRELYNSGEFKWLQTHSLSLL